MLTIFYVNGFTESLLKLADNKFTGIVALWWKNSDHQMETSVKEEVEQEIINSSVKINLQTHLITASLICSQPKHQIRSQQEHRT